MNTYMGYSTHVDTCATIVRSVLQRYSFDTLFHRFVVQVLPLGTRSATSLENLSRESNTAINFQKETDETRAKSSRRKKKLGKLGRVFRVYRSQPSRQAKEHVEPGPRDLHPSTSHVQRISEAGHGRSYVGVDRGRMPRETRRRRRVLCVQTTKAPTRFSRVRGSRGAPHRRRASFATLVQPRATMLRVISATIAANLRDRVSRRRHELLNVPRSTYSNSNRSSFRRDFYR